MSEKNINKKIVLFKMGNKYYKDKKGIKYQNLEVNISKNVISSSISKNVTLSSILKNITLLENMFFTSVIYDFLHQFLTDVESIIFNIGFLKPILT